MKLFALRAADYMRVASPEDRRYLLYNPMVKMKVTTQGEEVINLLWDVIAAKGFEKDMYFEMAARDIRALPKLEGTVHVNIALIVKFMPNYFFAPAEYPPVPTRRRAPQRRLPLRPGAGAAAWARSGSTTTTWPTTASTCPTSPSSASRSGRSRSSWPPRRPTRRSRRTSTSCWRWASCSRWSSTASSSWRTPGSTRSTTTRSTRSSTSWCATSRSTRCSSTASRAARPAQMELCLKMIRKPVVDPARYDRVWHDSVYALRGLYEMNP